MFQPSYLAGQPVEFIYVSPRVAPEVKDTHYHIQLFNQVMRIQIQILCAANTSLIEPFPKLLPLTPTETVLFYSPD